MTLAAAFSTLWMTLYPLRDCIRDLQRIVGDRPPVEIPKPVDDYSDSIQDLAGTLQEVIAAAATGQRAIEQSVDSEQARRALTDCQAAFNDVLETFFTRIASYGLLSRLQHVGSERGGEWPGWAHTVEVSTRRCTGPLFAVGDALVACWQELAERAVSTSVSLKSTNIGQQIELRPEKEAVGEDIA